MEKLGISEQLIEQLPDAVFVVDPSGKIQFVNAQGEVLFGWRRDELIGRAIETLVPPNARAQHPGHRARYSAESTVRPMGAGLDLSGSARTAPSSRPRSRCPRSTPPTVAWSRPWCATPPTD